MKFRFLIVFFLICMYQTFSQSPIDDETVGVWQIKDGKLIENKLKETSMALHNWNIFYTIFPKQLTKKFIRRLVLISDGIDNKNGALGPLNKKNTQWELVLDTTDVNFKSKDKGRIYQSIYTMVHEFGHLLTLNNQQVRPTSKIYQEENEPYLTAEGEAYKNSYINKYVSRFWNGKLLTEWDIIQDKHCYTEESCLDYLGNLYERNSAEFVTSYAVESPEEDIAESWTSFVLKRKVKEPKTVSDQKRNFFYQFPELVIYRKLIRQNIRQILK